MTTFDPLLHKLDLVRRRSLSARCDELWPRRRSASERRRARPALLRFHEHDLDLPVNRNNGDVGHCRRSS
jgi:hypothetical protein